jgi:hypothetical protein
MDSEPSIILISIYVGIGVLVVILFLSVYWCCKSIYNIKIKPDESTILLANDGTIIYYLENV